MPAKNISLHVGLKVYDPLVYHEAPDLLSAANDAQRMYNLGVTLGYTALDLQPRGQWNGSAPPPPNVLIDSDAKYATVVKFFSDAATLLDEGDSCLVTYSGHGTQFDFQLPQPEGPNEAACLFDYALIDDIVVGLLADFKKGVDVFLVLDCCHAGANKDGGILQNDLDAVDIQPAANENPLFGRVKFAPAPTIPVPKFAGNLLTQFKGFDRSKLKANLAVFEACTDTQNTFDGLHPTELSVYSRKFVDAVADGTPTVRAVAVAIKAAPPPIENCDPQMQPSGDETFLDKPMLR